MIKQFNNFSFFENIQRIATENYVPTNQDILLSRLPTTGVVKLAFTMRNLQFK